MTVNIPKSPNFYLDYMRDFTEDDSWHEAWESVTKAHNQSLLVITIYQQMLIIIANQYNRFLIFNDIWLISIAATSWFPIN